MSSINTLVGTFSSVGSNYEVVPDELIAIDTSNNRLGINTIDPSYSIHVSDSNDSSGIIYTSKLIVNNEIFYIKDNIDPSLVIIDGITYNNLIYDISIARDFYTRSELQSGTLDLSFLNLDISDSLSVQNSITVGGDYVVLQQQFDNSFDDVYTKSYIDTSFSDVYTKSYIDSSFDTVYTKSELQSSTLDLSLLNLDIADSLSVQNSITVNGENVVLQPQFDSSFDNVYTKSHIDNSYSTIELSDNIIGIDVSKGFITFDSSYLYVRITDSSWGRILFTDYI